MNKIIPALVGIMIVGSATAASDTNAATTKSKYTIEPYVGTNIGVQAGYSNYYFGLNHSFFGNDTTNIVDYTAPNSRATGVGVESKSSNIVNIDIGYKTDKFFVGPQIGFDSINVSLSPHFYSNINSVSKMRFGVQGGYYFDNNIFVRADVSYSSGFNKVSGFNKYTGKNEDITLSQSVGSGFHFNISVGYRFSL